LAAANSASSDKRAPGTMIHATIQSDLPPIEKSCERILKEVATVAGAGYESTVQALRLIICHIYSSKEILRRLREELASMSNASSSPIELRG
jgi:cytochrome P450